MLNAIVIVTPKSTKMLHKFFPEFRILKNWAVYYTILFTYTIVQKCKFTAIFTINNKLKKKDFSAKKISVLYLDGTVDKKTSDDGKKHKRVHQEDH